MDLKQKLSENFTLSEMVKSETALRHGLDNIPGQTEVDNLRLLAEKVLQPVREHYKKGVKVNSGFRHPEVNAAVGGSKTSDHCKGQAADIEIPGVANADLAEWIKDNLEFDQLIYEFGNDTNPDWVHVSYESTGKQRKQVLRAYKEAGKTKYKPY